MTQNQHENDNNRFERMMFTQNENKSTDDKENSSIV